MKEYKHKKITTQELYSVTCDICKKIFKLETDSLEIEEFIHIYKECGYDSVFGDEKIVKLDMCQYCFNKHLGEFVRIE
jgi:hypothetical protein